MSLYLAAYVFGGYFTFREAFESVLARRFEIDFLMLVAALGAASLGEWAEGALLLFLFSLGHSLEHFAMGRAKRAIEALAELAPQTALVRRNGNTDEISVDLLQVADVVVVKPNERIAADGFVIKGEGSVNQAPITGESVPVDKRPVADPQRLLLIRIDSMPPTESLPEPSTTVAPLRFRSRSSRANPLWPELFRW